MPQASEPPASELKKLVREYMSVCGYNKFERPEEHWHFKALMSLLEVLESTTLARGRKAGLEQAAKDLLAAELCGRKKALVDAQAALISRRRFGAAHIIRALAGEPASKEGKP